MTILTTIFDCNGTDQAVTTIQRPGESDQDFIDRHNAEVKAAKAKCDEAKEG